MNVIEVCLSVAVCVEALCVLYLLWVTRHLAATRPKMQDAIYIDTSAERQPPTPAPAEMKLSSGLPAGDWTQPGKGEDGLPVVAGSTTVGESTEEKLLREKAGRVFAGALMPRRLDSGEIARREHFLTLHANGGQISPGTPTRKVD